MRRLIALTAALALTSLAAEPIDTVAPIYPELAKQAHIQGTVRLAAWIDEDGVVDRLELISGHPFLVKAAIDAAKHWRYPPRAMATVIEITFSLGGPPSRPTAPRYQVAQGSRPAHS